MATASFPALSHYSATNAVTRRQWRTGGRPIRHHFSSTVVRRRPRAASCSSKSREESNFTDQILDYIEGGPKLRKWYGAPDLLPKDGGLDSEEETDSEEESQETRDAVLVTNGDSEIGQLVILSLIVKRVRVKALVKDKRAAVEAFGTYVEPIDGNSDAKLPSKAFNGVRAIICPSNEGFLYSIVGQMKGIQHIIILSQLAAYRGSSGLQALLNSNLRKLAEKDEEVVISSGIPYTLINAAILQDSPGGKDGFSFTGGVAANGKLSKEDAARICVEALDVIPPRGLTFEVGNGEEKVTDWKEFFTSAIKKQELL